MISTTSLSSGERTLAIRKRTDRREGIAGGSANDGGGGTIARGIQHCRKEGGCRRDVLRINRRITDGAKPGHNAAQVALADGIYASRALLPGEEIWRDAMTYVGNRPTVNTGARQIETNVLDFDGDLYGQVITVQLLQRLRADEHFPTVEAMVAQLRQDEIVARTFFAELTEAID